MAGVFSVDHLVFQQASTITHCNLVPLVPDGICLSHTITTVYNLYVKKL